MPTAASVDLLLELLLIGMRRTSEFGEAIRRMRAGGPEVSDWEIEQAGLSAEAAIVRARLKVNAEPPIG